MHNYTPNLPTFMCIWEGPLCIVLNSQEVSRQFQCEVGHVRGQPDTLDLTIVTAKPVGR